MVNVVVVGMLVVVVRQFAHSQWRRERKRLQQDEELDSQRTELAKHILLKCMRVLSTGDALSKRLRAAHQLQLQGRRVVLRGL